MGEIIKFMSTFEQGSFSPDLVEKNLTNEQLESQEEKEKMEIKVTDDFQKAIEKGWFNEAMEWLEQAKGESKYDARWLDHRSDEIMEALCNAGRIEEAEKYVDYAKSEKGRNGRREKIERLKKEKA